jgi:hypothetical protein
MHSHFRIPCACATPQRDYSSNLGTNARHSWVSNLQHNLFVLLKLLSTCVIVASGCMARCNGLLQVKLRFSCQIIPVHTTSDHVTDEYTFFYDLVQNSRSAFNCCHLVAILHRLILSAIPPF